MHGPITISIFIALVCGSRCSTCVRRKPTSASIRISPANQTVLFRLSRRAEAGRIDAIDDISFEINSIATAEHWQKILNALNSGYMPPQDEPQLKADDKARLLAELSQRMVESATGIERYRRRHPSTTAE